MMKLRKIGVTMMSGKKMMSDVSFVELFDAQMNNQISLIRKGSYEGFSSRNILCVPIDDPALSSYHVQQLISEIGEVLDADKRWKNFRNKKYDENAKLEEIADCFIVLMNIAMFSGFNGAQTTEAIIKKLKVVKERIGEI